MATLEEQIISFKRREAEMRQMLTARKQGVVTLRKLNKNKMVSNYLVRCPGLFDVKILGWFDRLHFLGLECRLKDIVFH